jgi:hypothetical protein
VADPDRHQFIALVQKAGRQGDWTLVHNSAFALDRAGFRFSPTIGGDGTRKPGERVTLRQLGRTIAEIATERGARARALDMYEPDAKKGRWFGEMEMPTRASRRCTAARRAGWQGNPKGPPGTGA